jgi:hypothetical protein
MLQRDHQPATTRAVQSILGRTPVQGRRGPGEPGPPSPSSTRLSSPQEPLTTTRGKTREDKSSPHGEVPLARTTPARKEPGARRRRPKERRRGRERAPAPLFHGVAAATSPPAPPRKPTLLSTRLRHGSGVPPLSHHRNGGRRGRGPTNRPSAERGWRKTNSLFASPNCSTGERKRACALFNTLFD